MPLNHGFDEYFGIPYSNDMWPNHPYQGKWFDFDPLFLYENEKVIDTLTDQSQLTTHITEKSVAFINKHKDEPFFLYVPHPQPHVPLFVSDKFKGKSKRGLYGDVIMEIDWSVGQIMKTLKENGLEENTIVIFTSDNGPWLSYGNHAGSALPYREGKGTAWEGGQREPFVIKYPKEIPMGKRSHTPVMGIDVLPTLAKQVDASLPDHPIDGKDVWEVFTLKTDKSPQEAYFFYYRVNELHAVRSGDWKLYFPHRYRSMNGQTPGKDGIPGDYIQIDLKEQELYNLVNDERETTNVASQYPEIVKQLNDLADQMRAKLGDNLSGMKSGSETREAAFYNMDQ
jgi:arylsulfatase